MIKKNENKPVEVSSMFHRMERMMGGAAKGEENERAAQELVYDAWECACPDDASDLLAQAVELDPTNTDAWQNGHAMAYFLEHRKAPEAMPNSYGVGSREEAIIAWDILKPAWKTYPEAQTWLKKNRGRK